MSWCESDKYIIYFNNFKELNFLINTCNFNRISNNMKEHNTERINDSLKKWKNIIEKIFTTI